MTTSTLQLLPRLLSVKTVSCDFKVNVWHWCLDILCFHHVFVLHWTKTWVNFEWTLALLSLLQARRFVQIDDWADTRSWAWIEGTWQRLCDLTRLPGKNWSKAYNWNQNPRSKIDSKAQKTKHAKPIWNREQQALTWHNFLGLPNPKDSKSKLQRERIWCRWTWSKRERQKVRGQRSRTTCQENAENPWRFFVSCFVSCFVSW